MKKPDIDSRVSAGKNDRQARQAEALRANLRRRKAFIGKSAEEPDSGAGSGKELTEKPNG